MSQRNTKEQIANALLKCGQEIFVAMLESVKVEPVANARMLYCRKDAAEMLDVSTTTIDKWRVDGTLKAVYPFGKGKEARYTRRSLEQLLKNLEKT